jgi:hypothetical protein
MTYRGCSFVESTDPHKRVVRTCKNYYDKYGVPPNVVMVGGDLASRCHAAYKLTFPDGTVSVVTVETYPVKSELVLLAGVR